MHVRASRSRLLEVHWSPWCNEVIIWQPRALHSEAGLWVAVSRPARSQVAAVEPIVVRCPPHFIKQ